MNIKKCAAIALNMYVKDLLKYNTVLYANILYWKKKKKKKNKHERPKDVW